MNYFPGLALNLDLPDLCLLSSQDHRREVLAPSWLSGFWRGMLVPLQSWGSRGYGRLEREPLGSGSNLCGTLPRASAAWAVREENLPPGSAVLSSKAPDQ
jgi:hypothetical protein